VITQTMRNHATQGGYKNLKLAFDPRAHETSKFVKTDFSDRKTPNSGSFPLVFV